MKNRVCFNGIYLLLLSTALLCCDILHAFRTCRTPNNPFRCASVYSFEVGHLPSCQNTFLQATSKQEENDTVEIGSKEYFRGMMSRSVEEEPEERVTGDKILGPTLRLTGGVAGVLVALVLGFLLSNGIITW